MNAAADTMAMKTPGPRRTGWMLAALAAALCSALAIDAARDVLLSDESVVVAPPVEAAVVRERADPCSEGCGTVEAVRTIEAVGGEPASYEITLRLRDGTSHVSRNGTSSWEVGDRVILIGRPAPKPPTN